MSLRGNINKIVDSDTSLDKGLLIVAYFEDMGFSLDGNGWLDDDPEALEKHDSEDVINELRKTLR